MSLQQLTSNHTKAQLEELRLIGINLEKSARKKREKYQHPLQSDLRKVIRVGSNYIFEGIRVSHTEIDLIEAPDFLQRVEVVKKITNLIKGQEFEANKRIWSILETCVIICVIYDHSLRNQVMKELTLNHLNFYSELQKTFKLQRKFEAYSRKLRDVKDQKLTLDDIKKVLEVLESHKENIGALNKHKIVKINNKIVIEPFIYDFAQLRKRASEIGQKHNPNEERNEPQEQPDQSHQTRMPNEANQLNHANEGKKSNTKIEIKSETNNYTATAPEVLEQMESLEMAMFKEILDIIPSIEMDELERLYRLYDNNMERLIQQLINIYQKQQSSEESSTEAQQ